VVVLCCVIGNIKAFTGGGVKLESKGKIEMLGGGNGRGESKGGSVGFFGKHISWKVL